MGYYEKIRDACRYNQGEIFSVNEIFEILKDLYPKENIQKKSILLADYCYNCVNQGINFNKHIFLRVGEKSYKFVDEDFPYEGGIFYTSGNSWSHARKVGVWVDGEYCFWEKFNKIPEEYLCLEEFFGAEDLGEETEGRLTIPGLIENKEGFDEWKYGQILTRRGQNRFRKELIRAYSYRCAVTGCDVVHSLEAAHIMPHSETRSYSVRNGILLRSDIHTLFDIYLISIEPETYRVVISEKCQSHYGSFQGVNVLDSCWEGSHPDPSNLEWHFKRWRQRSRK